MSVGAGDNKTLPERLYALRSAWLHGSVDTDPALLAEAAVALEAAEERAAIAEQVRDDFRERTIAATLRAEAAEARVEAVEAQNAELKAAGLKAGGERYGVGLPPSGGWKRDMTEDAVPLPAECVTWGDALRQIATEVVGRPEPFARRIAVLAAAVQPQTDTPEPEPWDADECRCASGMHTCGRDNPPDEALSACARCSTYEEALREARVGLELAIEGLDLAARVHEAITMDEGEDEAIQRNAVTAMRFALTSARAALASSVKQEKEGLGGSEAARAEVRRTGLGKSCVCGHPKAVHNIFSRICTATVYETSAHGASATPCRCSTFRLASTTDGLGPSPEKGSALSRAQEDQP